MMDGYISSKRNLEGERKFPEINIIESKIVRRSSPMSSNDVDSKRLKYSPLNGYYTRDKPKRQNVSAFLSKTYDIFSNSEFQARGICGWSPKGDSVIIHNLREFSDTVLPMYFKHGNFQSFVRQLNMYNFKKTVADPTHGEFKHPLFRRGMRDVLDKIKRKPPSNGNKSASSSSVPLGLNCVQSGFTDTVKEKNVTDPILYSSIDADLGENLYDHFSGDASGLLPLKVKNEESFVLGSEMETDCLKSERKILESNGSIEKAFIKIGYLENRQQIAEERLKEIEEENKLIKQENSLLWKRIKDQASNQRHTELKIQKLLFCMYEMYIANGGHSHTAKNLLADASMTLSQNSVSADNCQDFQDETKDDDVKKKRAMVSQNRTNITQEVPGVPLGFYQRGNDFDFSTFSSNFALSRQDSLSDLLFSNDEKSSHSLLLEKNIFQENLSNKESFGGQQLKRITSVDWHSVTLNDFDNEDVKVNAAIVSQPIICNENKGMSTYTSDGAHEDLFEAYEIKSNPHSKHDSNVIDEENCLSRLESSDYEMLSRIVEISKNSIGNVCLMSCKLLSYLSTNFFRLKKLDPKYELSFIEPETEKSSADCEEAKVKDNCEHQEQIE